MNNNFFIKVMRLTKKFYFLAGVFFLLWMVFLDSNDLITQVKLKSRIHELEEQKLYYQDKIKEVEKDRKELLGNDQLLEKFAREKYLMKKKSEDLFVIVEDE